MSTTVRITDITGATPFDIWVCEDCSSNNCQYITTITTGDLPNYEFILPSNFEYLSSYTVRIIDDNNCVICNTL